MSFSLHSSYSCATVAAQAKAYTQQKDRMRQQESEIAALKRQLESMQIAASRARAGGAGRRQMDGSVPAEYVCPITQVRSQLLRGKYNVVY